MVPLSMTLSDLCPGFQGHDIFWSPISEERRVLKRKLLLHKRKLCLTWNGTMFDWPLNASRWFVSIGWVSCLISISSARSTCSSSSLNTHFVLHSETLLWNIKQNHYARNGISIASQIASSYQRSDQQLVDKSDLRKITSGVACNISGPRYYELSCK